MFTIKYLSKSVVKFFKYLWEFLFIRIIGYILALIAIYFIGTLLDKISVPDSFAESFESITDVIKSTFSTSVIFGAVLNEFRLAKEKNDEEGQKTEQDEHKIIRKYTSVKFNGHIIGYREDKTRDYYDDEKDGYIMQITNLDHDHEALLHSDIYDKHNFDKKREEEYMKYFIGGKDVEFINKEGKPDMIHVPPFLNLPTLNMYTNFEGKTKFVVSDSQEVRELPDLVIENFGDIMNAHKFSKVDNGETIRLHDFEFNRRNHEFHITTERSTYYSMLATNRAMDYNIDGMTLRKLFEYKPRISKLADSELGNQIGINGVIITNDGYLLIEKRDKKKSTWKNKFGQPISLALKSNDMFFGMPEQKLTTENIEEKFVRMLKKTLKMNFGLNVGDYKEITLANNFMGLARDVLEGGKPNFYFFVELNMNAYEAADLLQKNASLDVAVKDEKGNSIKDPLLDDKLKSDFYLVHFDKCKVDFDYGMYVRPFGENPSYKVRRRLYPRKHHFYLPRFVKRTMNKPKKEKVRYTKRRVKRVFFRRHKEVGQAMLVCFAYLELIRARIPNLGGKQ